MKKIFSALIALCMVLSMTAFAATDAKIKITATDAEGNEITEAEVGDVIAFTVSTTGDTTGLIYAGCAIGFNFNADELSFDEDSFDSDYSFNGACAASVADSGDIITFQNSPNGANKNDAKTYYNNADGLKGEFIIGYVEATVLEGAKGKTIKFEKNEDTKMTYAAIKESTVKKITFENKENITDIETLPVITVKGDDPTPTPDPDPTPSEPTVTKPTDANTDNGGIVADKVKVGDNYVIAPIAPIGKKVVVKDASGTPITPNKKGEYTFTGDVEVTFEDDAATVITYVIPMSEIYAEGELGIAAFGKGTIAGDYGIKFVGNGFDADVPAKGNFGGIFAVELEDATAGDYTAQAYINGVYGNSVEFTK